MVGRPHRRGPSDTPPPAPPGAHQPWALPDPDADPTVYVPDREDYNDAQRGSLPPIGNLHDSWGYVSPTYQNNYRNIVVTLTTRLSIAFDWLVGDAEWVMGIARGAHGAEWGDFLHRGGAMTPGATERLMAAYLSRRGIPPPRSLGSLIQRTPQPHVPPPQPGIYGDAAVARMMARGTRLDGSSYSPQRTTATIITPPPRSRATTATRATNVRARTSAATSPTSPNPSTSAPPTPAAEPHQQHAGTEFIRHVVEESIWIWYAHAKARATLLKARLGPGSTMAWALQELRLYQQAEREGVQRELLE